MKKIFLLVFIVLTVYIATSAQESTEKIEPLLVPPKNQITAKTCEIFGIDLTVLERYNEGRANLPDDIPKVSSASIVTSAHENTEKFEPFLIRTDEQIIEEIREVFNRDIETLERFRVWRINKYSIVGGGDSGFHYEFAKVSSAISRIKKNRAVWEYENATTEPEKNRRGREALDLYGQLGQDLTKLVAEAAIRYNNGMVNSDVMVDAQIKRSEAFIEKLIFEQNFIRSMR